MTEFLGAEYAGALNMIVLLLPGTVTTYYGEEIAMEPIQVSYEDTQDPVGKYFGSVRIFFQIKVVLLRMSHI